MQEELHSIWQSVKILFIVTTSLSVLGTSAGLGLNRQPESINYSCALHDPFGPSHLESLCPISPLKRQESLSGSELQHIESNLDL